MDAELQQTGDNMDAAGPLDNAVVESQDAGQAESKMVPLESLQSERQKRQALEDDFKMWKENVNLMMAQNSQRQAPPEPSGPSDDDVMTFGEFKRALQQEKQQVQMTLEELRMTQKYPDYQEVVTKYLPEVVKTNPSLAKTLQSTNDYELAYYLAKKSDGYQQSHKTVKRNADAVRIVQNASQAGSLSSVGQTSPISEAKRYKDMSDSDFMKLHKQNLGYF